jgi:hypothetical protein
MILFVRSRGHARRRAHRIIGVSPVSPIPGKGADKARRQTLPTEPLADFKPPFRNTGGTPMILFARSRGHARRWPHRIIGVSPVSPIPGKDADKARRQTLPREPLADFKPSFCGTGGAPMILFVQP